MYKLPAASSTPDWGRIGVQTIARLRNTAAQPSSVVGRGLAQPKQGLFRTQKFIMRPEGLENLDSPLQQLACRRGISSVAAQHCSAKHRSSEVVSRVDLFENPYRGLVVLLGGVGCLGG